MKTSISVELVPRSAESVIAEAALVATYPEVTHINIPDMEKFSLRSVEAIWLIREKFGDRFVYVPHIRAIASAFLPESFPGDIALIVQGDIPPRHKNTPQISAIEHICELPKGMRIMAALDPYRSSLAQELLLMRTKIDAGAVGFFTQPFFSLPHMRYWESILPTDCEIFFGISPITTEASLAYWRDRNHVVFPNNFSHAVSRQVAFARSVIRFARARGRSVYLMPIRIPLALYLQKVFA